MRVSTNFTAVDASSRLTYRAKLAHHPMIRVRNLSFTHPGNISALQNIDLVVERGERIALIGPNGSGKSTLARCIHGLETPSSGEVSVDGNRACDSRGLQNLRGRVGMVFQNPDDQLVATSVEAEVAFGLENLGVVSEEIQTRVTEILGQFKLHPYRKRPPQQLSGGEKQRVAVAAAMVLRPNYLILDEPTALLDPQGTRELLRIIADLHDAFDLATVHITQVPDEAISASRVLVLKHGQLIMDGPPEQVFSESESLLEFGLSVPFASAVSSYLRVEKNLAVGTHLTTDTLAAELSPELSMHDHDGAPIAHEAAGPKLATQGLCYTYEANLPTEQPGLVDLTMEIPTGGITAVVGPSGSGKTTLAQHYNALLKPHRGRVLLDGVDIWQGEGELIEIRRRVGLVFQFPELQLFEESCASDVAFGPKNLGCASELIEERVELALHSMGLPRKEFGDRSPFSLSAGEKRRVAIAGVLAMEPEVLVLDEPTAGLDHRASDNLCQHLRQLHEEGTTIVVITHDMDLVAELTTYLAVLIEGRLAVQGGTREVLTREDFQQISQLEHPAANRLMRELGLLGCTVPSNLIRREEVIQYLEAALSKEQNESRS